MLNFTHRLLLGLLMFLTASCFKPITYEDVKSKKYGVLVVRAVYYHNKELSSTMDFESYVNGQFEYTDNFRNILTKHEKALYEEYGNSIKYMAASNYRIAFAKPGKHNIRKFYSPISDSMMNLKLNKNHLCIDVKPGEINYIGDIYLKKGKKVPTGFFENKKFHSDLFAQDKSEEARNFMKKYYPEFDLPFNSSLLTMDNCENS